MGSKKAPKPSKEQNDLAKAQAAAMYDQMAFNRESFDWMKGEALLQRERGDEEFAFQRGLADKSMAWAQEDRDFYYDTTGEQVKKFTETVNNYDTGAERDRIAGRAMVDVEDQLERGRAGLGREMGARGMNSGSGAYLASLTDMETSGALAKASASTMAQEAARREGLQLRAQAAGLGSGFGSSATGSMRDASGFSSQGLDAGGQGMRSYGTAVNTYNSGQGVANSWGSSANSTMNSIAEQNYKRSQSGGGGFGAILGSVAGAAAGTFGGGLGTMGLKAIGGSDRRLKTDIKPVGRLANGLTVYEYRYRSGGPLQIGVMADEVERVLPQAVIHNAYGDGYAAVNYALL